MMRIYHLIYAVLIVEAKNLGQFCEVVIQEPRKQCFVKDVLVSITHSPNQLAVDQTTNTVYFSFDSGQGEYVPAMLKIENKKLTVLKGVKDAFAIANDPIGRNMYFGGSHGIYKYNIAKKTLKRLNINNLDIWWLFFKKDIYFIKFPSLYPYYFGNGTVKSLSALRQTTVHQMVLDTDNNIFFINNTGLYGIRNDGWLPVLVRDNPRFLGIATDNNGFVYVCSEDGIYVVSKMILKVKKIVHLQGVLGFTFDKSNNIIYSDSHDLVRLVPLSMV